jgi:hypothetical protein
LNVQALDKQSGRAVRSLKKLSSLGTEQKLEALRGFMARMVQVKVRGGDSVIGHWSLPVTGHWSGAFNVHSSSSKS